MASLAVAVDPLRTTKAGGARVDPAALRRLDGGASAPGGVIAGVAGGARPEGFKFDNCFRNKALGKAGVKKPKVLKTGTTICGVVYNGGIVLGADTRSTAGMVADKNCEKIHYIAPNIYACGAGTAADTEMTTLMISSQLELARLNSGSASRVSQAMTKLKRYLFRYQGHVSAALVLGGVDATGAHLYTIYPHGSTDKLPFVTMGSGSLAAMAVFERGYKDDMTEEEAVDLVHQAIDSGIFNDLGSGSNVDICVIRDGAAAMPFDPKSVDYRRNAWKPNEVAPLRAKVKKNSRFDFPPGTSKVKSVKVIDKVGEPKLTGMGFLEEHMPEPKEGEGAAMDTS